MLHRRLLFAAGLLLAGAAVLYGFRSARTGDVDHQEVIRYRWFQPHRLLFGDRGGIWCVAVMAPEGDRHHAAEMWADVLGRGAIDVVTKRRGESPWGAVEEEMIASNGDGRLDVALEFHGAALTKAALLGPGGCAAWRRVEVKFELATRSYEECADAAAFRSAFRSEIDSRLLAMRALPERRAFLLGRYLRSRARAVKASD
jgi:hypothetical protein